VWEAVEDEANKARMAEREGERAKERESAEKEEGKI